MRLIRSSLSSNSGFTVVELLTSGFLGLIVLAMALSAAVSHKGVLQKDSLRTRLNQNLRGSLDILGTDARVAGENLGPTFPVVEVTNGASGAAG